MINSALTCRVGQVGVHYNIWKPFITSLCRNLSSVNPGLIWVLFGKQASSFRYDIRSGNIIEEYHPAYYARRCEKMPNIFLEVNRILKGQNGEQFQFYKEYGN